MTTSTENHTGIGQYIVVIDTGYSTSFDTSNVAFSYDLADGDYNALQWGSDVHGAFVGAVVSQTASDAQIIHLKVFSDNAYYTSFSLIQDALEYTLELTATYNIAAVNLSLGTSNTTENITTVLTDEFQALDDMDILVSVSAGNYGHYYSDGINIIAANDNVVAVSAVDDTDWFTSWSQRSETLTDIASNGIVSITDRYGTRYTVTGTSFSAPTIAAIAALLQQASLDVNRLRLSDEDILEIMQLSGRDVAGYEGSDIAGYKVADADAAVAFFLEHAGDYAPTSETQSFITHSDEADFVTGTNGADKISTFGGQDTIDALGGNDTIDSGEGADLLSTGDGHNYVLAGGGDDTVYGSANGNDTIYGENGDDDISAGGGDNLIYGDAGGDTITSLGGDDTVYGGDGEDYILTGDGNDLIYGGSQADFIDSGDGDDLVDSGNGQDGVTLGAGNDRFIDNEQGGHNGRDHVSGGDGHDTLLGGGGDDYLLGSAGKDSIFGGADDDYISGGTGWDSIEGGTGADFVDMDSGNDIFHDHVEDVGDTVRGGAGHDTIYGLGGDDWFEGGLGNDLIYAGDGEDVVFGNDGNNTIYDGSQMDYVDAGDGRDAVYSGNGRDTIYLGLGDDAFYDNDQEGHNGRDTVYGGNGKDTIHSGGGDDLFYGDNGYDVFVFDTSLSLGDDTIADFTSDDDLIEMHGVTLADLTITQASNDTLIEWSDGSVTLRYTDADKITQDDFMFL